LFLPFTASVFLYSFLSFNLTLICYLIYCLNFFFVRLFLFSFLCSVFSFAAFSFTFSLFLPVSIPLYFHCLWFSLFLSFELSLFRFLFHCLSNS
jgi:hypothetical protein